MSSIWTIRRSTTDVKLTGLCAGVARYWGIDPTLVRVGVALLALSGGVGLVLYLAGWLLIPVEGKTTSPIDDFFGPQARRWSKEIWIAIVAVACIISFAILGGLTPFGVGPAIILAGIWYFGFYRARRPRSRSTDGSSADAPPPANEQEFLTSSGPPTPFTEEAEAWRERIEEHARQTAPAPAANLEEPPSPADVESEQRRAFLADPDPVGIYSPSVEIAHSAPVSTLPRVDSRSAKRLRLISLVVLVLTVGGIGLADVLGASVPVAAYFGAALLVVGAALMAGAWFGRARGVLPLGILLLVGLLLTSAISTAIRNDDWAPQTLHSYTTVAELPADGDRRDFGRLTTDLSDLNLTGDATYKSHVDLGTLTILVPPEAQVRVNYSIDSGAVEVFDTVVAAGNELQDVYEPETTTPGAPVLTLDLSADMGKVVVQR